MAVKIELPAGIRTEVRLSFATRSDAAKLELAVAAYAESQLSLGQFAALLRISQYDADRILQERRVLLPYTLHDLEKDVRTLDELLKR